MGPDQCGDPCTPATAPPPGLNCCFLYCCRCRPQTSPSGSHAATHATQLLREASSAVDSTRHAVQRGDTVWLDMVSGTLKQVEAALEALTDFR